MGGGHARTAPAEGVEERPCSGLSLRTSKMLMVQWGRSWRLDKERASEREKERELLERETRDWRCRSLRNENSEKGEGEGRWGLGVCRCRVEKLRGCVLVD